MNNLEESRQQTALSLLETVPLIMQQIRAEMRAARGPELSIPQFRALGFIGRHDGASLSEVAEHLGLMRPAACKIVDDLVTAKLATRHIDPEDRRRISLGLTAPGRRKLQAARQLACSAFAARLENLSADQQQQVNAALDLLKAAFSRTDEHPGK